MFIVIDTETDGLVNPTKVWVAVVKEVDTGKVHVFRHLHQDQAATARLRGLLGQSTGIIGHNLISYDLRVLDTICGIFIDPTKVVDTLVVARLFNYSAEGGNSLDAIGQRLGFPKGSHSDWSQWSQEMEDYCIRDVEVTLKFYEAIKDFLFSESWKKSLRLEHDMAFICEEMRDNGFAFDYDKAQDLYKQILDKLEILDRELVEAFPPKAVLVKEITPRATASGTIHRRDFRWLLSPDLTPFSVGSTFSRIEFEPFNPGSPKQIVERLNAAGWQPTEKTKGHLQAERDRDTERLTHFRTYGWKVSEENLKTLHKDAPQAAHKLVERLLLDSRRSTLVEWFNVAKPIYGTTDNSPERQLPNNVKPVGSVDSKEILFTSPQDAGQDKCGVTDVRSPIVGWRIHGKFNHIGAWTGRMSHAAPNMANIPAGDSLYAHEMRSFWTVENGNYLVGVDADGIQLRILAHYMNDRRFTEGLVNGRKEDGTDAHTLNKLALGSVCKDRDTAKTFIYAFLLGAGVAKVAEILGCTHGEARQAVQQFIQAYPGLKALKEEIIPRDAARGYFIGLDGRAVLCDSEHHMLAGYLQNGEAIVMKTANRLWRNQLKAEGITGWKQVNFVHDEWQTEVEDFEVAKYIAQVQANSIKEAGILLGVRCPLEGSFLNSHKELSIGKNWMETH